MCMRLGVDEVLHQGNDLVGKHVMVYGVMLVRDDECYVVANVERDFRANAILLGDSNLISKLLAKVPCLIGGKYLYREDVEVCGRISYDETQGCTARLVELKSLSVKTTDMRVEIV